MYKLKNNYTADLKEDINLYYKKIFTLQIDSFQNIFK